MEKRRITFGGYDTAAHGWTLTKWKLTEAKQKTNFLSKPGGDGSWDLSTALTGGIPRYNDRTLTATFECSEGDRLSREAKIREMVNTLSGMRMDIGLPDDPYHHLNGRVQVARDYNDLAHCSVTVTATCGPWKESNTETKITLVAHTSPQTALLVNNGRRAVVPLLTVSGGTAGAQLAYANTMQIFSPGTYKWPVLLLTPGSHNLNYRGDSTVVITYREAVLE